MSLFGMIKGKGPSGFGYGSTAEQVTEGLDLSGQTMLVTGCNSGLGLETVRVLAKRGARVLAAARSQEKAKAACAALQGHIIPLACELSDPAAVRACVDAVTKEGGELHAVICNEGAATQCYVATHPALDGVSGEYFADCNLAPSSARSRDAELARRLWEESERIALRL